MEGIAMQMAMTDDLEVTFESDITLQQDTGFEPTEASAVRREARVIGQSAQRFARGDSPDETENERALAGLVRHLAGQVERLATLLEVAP
jgi:hypothetical protein